MGSADLASGEVEVVNVPTKLIMPRRFDIILEMRGVTWRRIQFEVSPDEAGVSEEHETIEPPDSINDRARDVVDLLLLRDLAESTGSPTLTEIRQAAMAVFIARTDEAAELGLATRDWPPALVAHAH